MNRPLILLATTFLWTMASHAQTTFGAITGVVMDPSGAAVPSVKVTARQVETNAETSAFSNDAGVYTLPQLREGAYEVRASAAGFRPWMAQAIQLSAREIRRLDIKLDVGSVETVVDVTDSVALIETETARIGDSKTGARLNHLPVPSRDIRMFLSLSPNVGGSRNADSFRMAGSFQAQNEFTVDGITVNNGYTSTPIVPLVQYIESFQELRLDTANNTAEFGAIGQFTVTTKAGTNQLRGSAFDYYVTPAFRSRNPFATERPAGISHQPGFSVGGPVVLPKLYKGLNKTFFFASLETSRGSTATQLMNATVASDPWRAGDFGSLAVRDPMAGNAPFPNNRIPQARLNPTSLKIQDRFFPRPNYGDPNVYAVNNRRNVLTYPFQPNTLVTARLDHRFNDKSFFYVRGSYNRATFDYFDGALPTIGRRWNRRDTRGLNISHTQFLTNSMVNEFRYGLPFNNNGRNGPQMGKEVANYLGLLGLADNLPDVNGIFNVAFQNLPLTGISQTQLRKPGFQNWVQQFQNHLSWFKGKHSVKAGFLLTRVRFDDGQAAANLFGSATFSNRFTGQPYADFLLGIPTSTSRGFPFFVQMRERWAYDFFVQDEWKIRPDLTLSAGLRYEVHPQFSEKNGRQAIFDPATAQIGVSSGGLQNISPLMPLNYINVVEASSLGYPGSTLIKTDYNNFAPRLGLAWRPFGPNTVVRAGFGVFFDVHQQNRVGVSTPFEISEPAYTNPTTNPDVILPRVLPAGYAGKPAIVALPTALDANLMVPYSYQYNFTLEHQRWNTGFRASYIGTAQRQGVFTRDINQPVASTALYVDKPRPFPQFPGIGYFGNGAGHQFNSLTFEAERAYKSGLQWQASWAWSRDIGDVENAGGIEDAFNLRRERGAMQDIAAHRVTGNAIYELPFGKGKKWGAGGKRLADLAIGGWSVSAIYQYSTGDFLTPAWTGPDPTGTRFTQNRTPAQVTIRPDQLFDPNLDPAQRTFARYFDAAAFAAKARQFRDRRPRDDHRTVRSCLERRRVQAVLHR